jgi:serine protease Do
MRRFFTYGPSLVVLLAVAVTLVAAPGAIRQMQVAKIAANVTQAQHRLEQGNLLEQLNEEIEAVAQNVLPGVVHIEVRDDTTSRWVTTLSNGAGWFYDSKGHIVTNAHVVGQSSNVRVELFDGRVREADVVGLDQMTDVAVLKIDPSPEVFPLRRATADPLPIGSQVFAFGSPFGIKFSMSRGVVSGLGRSEAAGFMGMIGGYTNFIQTDAAMNPGNSGGPLVDVNGRVVGMNAAIANGLQNVTQSPTGDPDDEQQLPPRPLGQSAGIGFAIPIETVEAVVQQLLETDVILRGYLGVAMSPTTPSDILAVNPDDVRFNRGDIEELQNRLQGFVGNGVMVASVRNDEPAGKAGMQEYDVITSIAGRETPTMDVLRSIVSVQKPGSVLPVEIWRDGEELELKVRLGAAYTLPNGGLRYIPGSEDMTTEEIRNAIGHTGE